MEQASLYANNLTHYIRLACLAVSCSIILFLFFWHHNVDKQMYHRYTAFSRSRVVADSKSGGLSKTEEMLRELSLNGSSTCHNVSTRSFKLAGVGKGFDEEAQTQAGEPISIPTDTVFGLWIVSMGGDGKPRCAGGDYYETELAGEQWRSRPRVSDQGNGTYRVWFMVDGAFPGHYTFSVNLLFSNYHGLDLDADKWAVRPWAPINRTLSFLLVAPPHHHNHEDGGSIDHQLISGAISRDLPYCTPRHLQRCGDWQGRWTRSAWYNRTCQCQAGPDGRFDQCLPDESPASTCTKPWCRGRVSRLESDGWVYSAHCAFRVWEAQDAWDCLAGKWLFMWGDSNMQDYIRNILVFVLGYPVPNWANITTWSLDRSVQEFFLNPVRPDQALHVSFVFNGHHRTYDNGLGLDSLRDHHYRDYLRLHFNGSSSRPDAFIFNTGLHDGKHFASLSEFVDAADRAVAFWQSVFQGTPPRNVILRTTVAPAGASRYMQSNPHKMEVYNAALIDRFQHLSPHFQVIDAFDASFPFHFDHCCSDGGHYGRAPNVRVWPWNGEPHQYFVDLMLSHMLLTSLCTYHD